MIICRWHSCKQEASYGRSKLFCSKKCKNKHYVTERRRMLKQKAIEYKGGQCESCSYSKCIAALEFHHLDPNRKEFKIGSGDTRAWSVVQAELKKCILLCANCHREAHEEWRDR